MTGVQRAAVGSIPLGVLFLQVLGLAVPQALPSSLLVSSVNSPLFTSTALAISVLAFRRGAVGQLLSIGAAIVIVLMTLLVATGTGLRDSWAVALLGFWFAALFVSGTRIAKADRPGGLREFDRVLVMFALPFAIPLTLAGLWITGHILQTTYDNYFYAFDGLLPVPVARGLARFCADHQWAWQACSIVYYDFLFVLCAFVVLRWRQDGEAAGQLLARWVFATLVGYALYYWLPGVGPDVAFYGGGSNLDSLPSPGQVELTLLSGFEGRPRNAMPSLHVTWALLIAFASIELATLVRAFGALYALATVVATLGLREHYLIDLVVAVPFAVAVHASVSPIGQRADTRAKLVAVLGGAAMTGAWLLTIRYGTASLRGAPSIASLLVIATILASGWLLFRSEGRADLKVRSAARAVT